MGDTRNSRRGETTPTRRKSLKQKEGKVLNQDRAEEDNVHEHPSAGWGERGIVGFLSDGFTVSKRQARGPLQSIMQAGAVEGKRGEVLE